MLGQNRPGTANGGVALHAAGFIVRLPRLERNLFRAPNQPTARLEHAVRPLQCRQNPKVANMAKVAFLGLGVMGFPMAGHLVKKGGHEVTVYNRTAAKAKAWAEKFGGKTAPTPKAVAEGQDFVMCCVGNDHDLRAVTLGQDVSFSGIQKEATFVDHTTASAEIARELDAEATN